MIYRDRRAGLVVINPSAVQLKAWQPGVDHRRDRSHRDCALQIRLTPARHCPDAGDVRDVRERIIRAKALVAFVSVFGVEIEVPILVCDDPIQRALGPSAAASVAVFGNAVDEVLLGQRDERVSRDIPARLLGDDGAKRPVGAALLLVFDRRDGAGGAPVDRGRGAEGEIEGWLGGGRGGGES